MDLQDLWQQHKRWVLGIVAGVLVFFAARAVIESVFDSQAAAAQVRRTIGSINGEQRFTKDQLDAIEGQRAEFAAAEATIRDAVEFVPEADFLLADKGDPELYFPEASHRVRAGLLGRARELSVALGEGDLAWPAAVGRGEIERTLLALCVLEQAGMRLLEAGERVRRADPDALGLVSIDKLSVVARSEARRSTRRVPGDDLKSAAHRIDELRVAFTFRADVATTATFFEMMRARRPRIGLAPNLRITRGDQFGDPLLVRGEFSAVRIEDPE